MQTRRDQLHAYRFLSRRALAALVSGEPNAVEPPMRRLTLTTVSGVMIAILVAAGFALVGLIRPSAGATWKQPGAIIVERETGARYVLVDDVLHPALNYSSAVLAVAGQQRAHVVLVNRSELRHTARGAAIGIDGIPDSLPQAGNLVHGPWTVCSQQRAGAPDQLQAETTVAAGVGAARALPADVAVLAVAATGSARYLLWHGQRLPISSADVATSLGLQSAAAVTVGTAFLDAVPQGRALQPPAVPGAGAAGPAIAGQPSVVGQVVHVSDNDQFLVVLGDGVAPVNPVQAALLRTAPIGAGGRALPVVTITEDVALNLTQSQSGWAQLAPQFDGLPQRVPTVDGTAAQNGGLCTVFGSATAQPSFAVPPSTLPSYGVSSVVESDRSRQGVADHVELPPGQAALVRSAGGSTTVFVIAEPGAKYAVASAEVLSAFGYGNSTPDAVAPVLLPLLPTGPALDRAAVVRPAS